MAINDIAGVEAATTLNDVGISIQRPSKPSKQKRSRPKGGFNFGKVDRSLEEDHAAGHELIQVVEALIHVPEIVGILV